MGLRMNWSLVRKSMLVALCIVVGDFLLLAMLSHHFADLAPRWLLDFFHFIFWPFFITQHIFTRTNGDLPTHSEIFSAGLIDLIFFTGLVYMLWSLVARRQASR